MRLTKLTHPNCDVWIDLSEIVAMQRDNKLSSDMLFVPGADEPSLTNIVLRNNRAISVLETPAKIIAMMDAAQCV
jgi:hypothetical protein